MRISDWSSDVCSSDLDPQSSSCGFGQVGELIRDHLEIAFGQRDYDQSACDGYLLCDTVTQGRQVRNAGPPVLRTGLCAEPLGPFVSPPAAEGGTVSGTGASPGNKPRASANDTQPQPT